MFDDHYYINKVPLFLVLEPIRRMGEHCLIIPYVFWYIVIPAPGGTLIELVLNHHPCYLSYIALKYQM